MQIKQITEQSEVVLYCISTVFCIQTTYRGAVDPFPTTTAVFRRVFLFSPHWKKSIRSQPQLVDWWRGDTYFPPEIVLQLSWTSWLSSSLNSPLWVMLGFKLRIQRV